MTSSWFFLSTLIYDARSSTHQIYIAVVGIHIVIYLTARKMENFKYLKVSFLSTKMSYITFLKTDKKLYHKNFTNTPYFMRKSFKTCSIIQQNFTYPDYQLSGSAWALVYIWREFHKRNLPLNYRLSDRVQRSVMASRTPIMRGRKV